MLEMSVRKSVENHWSVMEYCIISERENQCHLTFSDGDILYLSVISDVYLTVTAIISVFSYVTATLCGVCIPSC